MLFNGKQLSDEELLSFAGVEEEATLYFLGALLGGAKKRKKKTYTKPKKQKHKPKKVRGGRTVKEARVTGVACRHAVHWRAKLHSCMQRNACLRRGAVHAPRVDTVHSKAGDSMLTLAWAARMTRAGLCGAGVGCLHAWLMHGWDRVVQASSQACALAACTVPRTNVCGCSRSWPCLRSTDCICLSFPFTVLS